MLRIFDPNDGIGSKSASIETINLRPDGADGITIPDAHLLFNAAFKRAGDDLVLTGEDGRKTVVPDYFKADKRPTLFSPDGAMLNGDLVDILAGPANPGEYAQAGAPVQAAAQEVGRVATASGNATAVRNGVAIALNVGDVILKGDVLQTGANSGLGVIFADSTTFTLTANARMVVNDLIYDPAGSNNSAFISLVQGTISFVAGQVAKTGDMRVDTPVASLGIRGTAVQVNINSADGTVRLSVMVEPGNVVGSFNIYSILPSGQQGPQIGTVNNAQIGWVLTPVPGAPPQAEQAAKTPEQIQQEFAIVQQVFQTQNLGQQILNQQPLAPPPPAPNSPDQTPNATPQSNTSSGSSGSTTPEQPAPQINIIVPNPPAPPPPPPPPPEDGGDNAGPQLLPIGDQAPPPPQNIQGQVATIFVETPGQTGSNTPQSDGGSLPGPTPTPGEPAPTVSVSAPLAVWEDSDGDLAFISDPGVLTLGQPDPVTGQVPFNYEVADGALDFLGEGDVLVVTFEVTITQGQNQSVQTIEVTIEGTNDAPVITSHGGGPSATIALVEGETEVTTVQAVDPDLDIDPNAGPPVAPAPTFSIVAQPGDDSALFNIDPVTGQLSFINAPAFDPSGSNQYLVTVAASDGIDEDLQTITVVVSGPNDFDPVAEDDSASVDEGGQAFGNVLDNDTDEDNLPPADENAGLTVIGFSQGAHGTVTIDANGDFVYTHDGSETTSDSFTYEVFDGANSATGTVLIDINPINDAPVANNDSFTTSEDVSLIFPAAGVLANDTDAEGNLLTAILVVGPTHGTLTFNLNGTFIYTPDVNFNGADSFTYKANDGALDSNVATVDLTINSVNDAPVAVNDSFAIAEDAELIVQVAGVLANDADADGDLLTAILVAGPAHGTLTLNPNGSFTYTPDANFNGLDSFTYKANDGTVDGNVATVNITVNPVNDAPVANNDSFVVDEDVPLVLLAAVGVLANDSDVEGNALTAILVVNPAHGTLTLISDGALIYEPDANFSGVDSFTYKVSDGAAESNVATVDLTINPVNDTPVAVNDSFAITEDAAILGGDVLANDTDVDGDLLTAILVAGPAHGTLTLNPDGSFTYTPDANFSGLDLFTYRANDGTVDGNLATVNVTVNPFADAPVANDDTLSAIAEDSGTRAIPASTLLANDTDVDNLPPAAANAGLSVTAVGNAVGGIVQLVGGIVAFLPDADFNGIASFDYTIDDGTGRIDTATATFDVTPVNDGPIVTTPSVAVPTLEDEPVVIPIFSVDDVDDANLTVTLTATSTLTLASLVGLSFTQGDGTADATMSFSGAIADINAALAGLIYTPTANAFGTGNIAFAFGDGDLTTTGNIAIAIAAVNDAPVADADGPYSVAENGVLNVNATNGVLAGDTDVEGDALTAVLVSGTSNAQSFTLNADGSFSYTPLSGFSGVDSFTYQASDGALTSNPVTVNINVGAVNDPPLANDDATTVNEGGQVTTVNVLLNDSDPDSPLTAASIIAVTQGAHGSVVDNDDGTFTYTHDGSETTTDSFTYTISDGEFSSVATVSVTINPVNDAPLVANAIANQNGTEDAPFSLQFAANAFADVDVGDTLIFTAALTSGAALPAWLAFDALTRTFSGTPANGDVGTISVRVTASDGDASVSDDFDITVANVNDAPLVANAIPNENATEDAPFSFQFAANAFADVDVGDTLTFTAALTSGAALPAWLTFDAATRTFSGTPANGDVGTVSVRVTASDGDASVSDDFDITVVNVNDAPLVANAIPNENTTENAPFSFQFAANAFVDVDVGDTLTFTAALTSGAALPAWLAFDALTRTFSGTPANGDVGTVSVRVTATDASNASVSDDFDITVANVNDAPTVANAIANQNATEDAPFSFQFAANAFADIDVGDTLTFTATLTSGAALPAWLSFDALTRTFSGTPANGDVGTISVRVTATDAGNASVSDDFDLIVANVNDAPTVANAIANQNATQDAPFSFQFAANAFADVDVGDTLTFTAALTSGAALPAWLTFDAATRTFSGTPANGDVGAVSVRVTATDASNASGSDDFDIIVANVNDPFSFDGDLQFFVRRDGSVVLTMADFTAIDPDLTDTLTFTVREAFGGHLTLNNVTLDIDDTFTQANLVAGVVRFVKDDPHAVGMRFTVDLTDGGSQPPAEIVVNGAFIDLNVTVLTAAGFNFDTEDPIAEAGAGTIQPSPTPTQFTIVNVAAHRTFVFEGTGFTFDNPTAPTDVTGGTLTRFRVLTNDPIPVPLFEATASFDAVAFYDALRAAAAGNEQPFEDLLADFVTAFRGGAGSDRFGTGPNDDFIAFSGGSDFMEGDSGLDRVSYRDAPSPITVDLALGTVDYVGGSDLLRGVEFVTGSLFGDTFDATGFGPTSANAGDANDIRSGGGTFNDFEGLAGDDQITGNGATRISYLHATAGVTVTLLAGGTGGAVGDASVGADTFLGGVVQVRGSNYNDTFTGNADSNGFEGRGGDDFIDGGAGFDNTRYNFEATGITVDLAAGTVTGASAGNDTLRSIESVVGTEFADVFIATGFSGASTNAGSNGTFNAFQGFGGDDTITGNTNTRAEYGRAAAGVTVDLAANVAFGTAPGDLARIGVDTLTDVPHARGSEFGDVILGGAAANTLEGLGGNDILNGRGGNDSLTGGTGADIFVYASNTGFDRISDFNRSSGSFNQGENDRIDLRPAGIAGFGALTLTEGVAISGGFSAQVGGPDTRITGLGTGALDLVGVRATDLVARNFIFAGQIAVTVQSPDGYDFRTLYDDLAGAVLDVGTPTPLGFDQLTYTNATRGLVFRLTVADAIGGEVITGTIRAIDIYDLAGNILVHTDGWNVVASDFEDAIGLFKSPTNDPTGLDAIFGTVSYSAVGDAGRDVLIGGDLADRLAGGEASDIFIGERGDDLFVGQGGRDIADYSDAEGPISADLAAGTVTGLTIGTDTLRSIEIVRGTDFNDTFTAAGFSGSSVNPGSFGTGNTFDAGGGSDTVTGNGGTFINYSGETRFRVDVTLGISSSIDPTVGTRKIDPVTSAVVGVDTFFTSGATQGIVGVFGTELDDALTGSANPFVFESFAGWGGDDFIDGRDGSDQAIYSTNTPEEDTVTHGIIVDLASGIVVGNLALGQIDTIGVDTLRSVEFIRGSRFADIFIADGFNANNLNSDNIGSAGFDIERNFFNSFDGRAGDDVILGNNNTELSYSSATSGVLVDLIAGLASGDDSVGDDIILGGVNRLIGTHFDDDLRGSANPTFIVEQFEGGAGNDFIDGRAGFDRAAYDVAWAATAGISVNLAAGIVTGDPSVGADSLRSIEFIRGTRFADTFDATGFGATSTNAGSVDVLNPFGTLNEFEGAAGNDTIIGNGDTRISFIGASSVGGGAVVNGVTINGVTVTFTAPGTGTATGGTSVGTDTFSGVNRVRGSNINDHFIGSDNPAGTREVFEGRFGDDQVFGNGGFDVSSHQFDGATNGIAVDLAAGTVAARDAGDSTVGNDTLRGVEGIVGTRLDDIYNATGFSGSSTNAGSLGTFNNFEGMGGDDTITGNGNTQVSYLNAESGVTVDLAAGTAFSTAANDVAGVGVDDITGGVNAVLGSAFDDTITGDALANALNGGTGNDSLTGGAGSDRFVFDSNFGDDTVEDFIVGNGPDHDVIDIAASFFANAQAVLDATTFANGDALIDDGFGNTITLKNVAPGTLTLDNFLVH